MFVLSYILTSFVLVSRALGIETATNPFQARTSVVLGLAPNAIKKFNMFD